MADDIRIDWAEESIRDIEYSLEKMNSGSEKVAATAAAEAAKKELEAAKAAAPVDTGTLQGGLVLVAERNKPKGKQVYQIAPSSALNSVFQRNVIHPGKAPNGKNRRKIAYYPASQEFGFATVNGGFVPGKHYLQGTLGRNSASLEVTMVEEINEQIDKAWG